MKIYTKTGDAGKTYLIGGKRVFKNDAKVEAYGTVDELLSSLGIVRSLITDADDGNFILAIQKKLMDIASILASDEATMKKLPEITAQDIDTLEREIDKLTASLPVSTYFVIPGENSVESFVHLSRSICRRAERDIVSLLQEEYFVPELLLKYINRLSDYLFTLARKLNNDLGYKDIYWIPEVK
ncbi:MAG: cob(I)yrinic acid a,c-diamide adenosyltransferase [Prevotellaceae bacterium]|jgi:cob(I)alamin adenosyltransferase|nr:cob(I)yrinic acid a,c-diamide adenosyltransferase [Prevotellaceae bacterium]